MKAVSWGLTSFPGREDTQHGLFNQDWDGGGGDWGSPLFALQGLIAWVGGEGGVGRQEEEQ